MSSGFVARLSRSPEEGLGARRRLPGAAVLLLVPALAAVTPLAGEGQATHSSPPEEGGGVRWVQATVIDNRVVPGSGEDGEPPRAMIIPPHVSSLPLLPVDPDADPGHSALEEHLLVSFDLRTGVESRTKASTLSLRGGSTPLVGGGSGAAALSSSPEGGAPRPGSRNMSGLFPVSNPDTYPFSANAKLWLDLDGDGSADSQCSGALIDPMHVITAGHCLYGKGHHGWEGWIAGVEVVPAWDTGSGPWDGARALQLHSWSGWTSSASWDHDLGVIDLDRPVGALSGWLGYRSRNSCGYYTDNNDWRHVGYPGESPFNGQVQYFQTGSFDDCDTLLGIWYGNNVSFERDTPGGLSGAAAYRPHVSCPSCWVSGVVSTGAVDQALTLDALINDDKYGDIGALISSDTPSIFDLVPMEVRTGSSLYAGGTLTSLSYLVHNYSSVAWSGSGLVDVWLSNDSDITTSDTYLQRHVFQADIGPKESVWVSVDNLPEISVNTATGDYWIGVIISSVTDPSYGNNDSDGPDAARLEVIGGADLVIQSIFATSSTPQVHEPFEVKALVANLGSAISGYTTMDLHREYDSLQVDSSGAHLVTTTHKLTTQPVPNLSAGAAMQTTNTVSLPTPGTYRFHHCIAPATNELPWDNNCSFQTEVSAGGCSGPTSVLLTDIAISDSRTYTACSEIRAGSSVTVPNRGDLTLQAGELVILENGLVVRRKGNLTVIVE